MGRCPANVRVREHEPCRINHSLQDGLPYEFFMDVLFETYGPTYPIVRAIKESNSGLSSGEPEREIRGRDRTYVDIVPGGHCFQSPIFDCPVSVSPVCEGLRRPSSSSTSAILLQRENN